MSKKAIKFTIEMTTDEARFFAIQWSARAAWFQALVDDPIVRPDEVRNFQHWRDLHLRFAARIRSLLSEPSS